MGTNLDMTGAGAVPGHGQPAQGGVGPLQDAVHFLTKLRVCLTQQVARKIKVKSDLSWKSAGNN